MTKQTCILTSKEDGQQFEVPIERAYRAFQACYIDTKAVKREFLNGGEINTTFGYYKLIAKLTSN